MKYKDYKRLSKISLKSRKKTTRSTVRGISFGLILLMPLLFIVIAFHIGLNNEVNKDASLRVFDIAYSKDVVVDYNSIYTMNDKYSQKIYDLDGIENIIKYNNYKFDNIKQADINGQYIYTSPFSITIDNQTFVLDYYMNNPENNQYNGNDKNTVGMQVFDISLGNSVFIKADKEVLNGENPLVAGDTFSKNSIGEIMVSSNFLKQYNLDTEDVLNKTMTINYELSYAESATTSKSEHNTEELRLYQNIPVTILKDFKVVGIFNSDIYKSEVRNNTQQNENYSDNMSYYETYFWVTNDSLQSSTGISSLPEVIRMEIETDYNNFYQTYYYYGDTPLNLSNNAKNNKNVFIPLGMGAQKTSMGNSIIPEYNTLIEFESYSAANKSVGTINALYEEGAGSVEDPYIAADYMQRTFENYRMFYNVFTYASLVLAIFGGVVFFATLLNLYNTIHYSVQSRRNYLGMIRAIGMRGKDVVKMYFVEVFQIFKRSYIWTLIFGGGICFGICYLFDMIMNSEVGQVITIKLSLNPIYILVAFLIILIVNTIISIAFSLIACHNVSKKPILEVLVENR